jgi:hypothetical protein
MIICFWENDLLFGVLMTLSKGHKTKRRLMVGKKGL